MHPLLFHLKQFSVSFQCTKRRETFKCHVFDVALGQGYVSKFSFGQMLNMFDLLMKQIVPGWEIPWSFQVTKGVVKYSFNCFWVWNRLIFIEFYSHESQNIKWSFQYLFSIFCRLFSYFTNTIFSLACGGIAKKSEWLSLWYTDFFHFLRHIGRGLQLSRENASISI